MRCMKCAVVCAFLVASCLQICYCTGDAACCKDNSSDLTTPAVPKIGEKSLKKCEEYKKFAYEEVKSRTQGNGKNRSCPFDAFEVRVGDYAAEPKEFPHMVLIGFDYGLEKDWLCAGTLISENFVLTAANCLKSRSHLVQFPTTVKLGDVSLNSSTDDERVQQIQIQDQIAHPDYSHISFHNDIALLKLESPAKLNAYARPACLYTKSLLETEHVLFTSWDSSSFAQTDTSTVRKKTWKVINEEKCAKSLNIAPYDGTVDPTQVCTVPRYQDKNVCLGNVGGPLTLYKDTKCTFDVVGITSFTGFCGSTLPAISTRVHPYLEWIESIVWP